MALNFPDNPSLNDTYADSTSGFTYTWNGTVWISTVDRKIGNIKQVDDISASFDGSEAVFDFLCNGEVIAPLETNKTIVSLGGVLQNPGDDYSVFGTQITFSTPPTNGLTFFAQVLQTDQSKSTLPNASVGPEALSTGGFSWNSSGDFIVSGILTSGTSSVTLDGDANQITVGTAATINESGITAGIVTGTFYGDGANLDGVSGTVGPTDSINTSGIITASSFTGDGRNLTDVGGYLAGLIYSPGIGNTEAATDTGIAITFTKSIEKNSGVINLRENSISGTIAESFDVATVGSSSTIAISGATLTITPDTTLGAGTTYFVEVPANTVRDTYDTGGNLGITSFTFVTTTNAGPGPFSLYVMGRGQSGQLAQNSLIAYSSPIQVPGSQWNNVQADMMNETMQGVKSDGTLWVWGANESGSLGQGDGAPENDRSSPVQVPGTQWVYAVSAYGAIRAKKTDDTFWVWGRNLYGESARNNVIYYSSPIQLSGTGWDQFGIGRDQTYFTKTDGSLWSWGYNYAGGLGLNDQVHRSSPTQIPGTSWFGPVGGYSRGMALKTDGTLWGWGINVHYGTLGQNDLINYSSPIQISGTQWTSISSGNYHNVAFKTDGTMWTWGTSSNGQLGLNDASNRSSPTQIPGTWDESQYACHRYGTHAKKTDGTLWAWGIGGYGGELGINESGISYSSPKQIPGTQWRLGGGVGVSTYIVSNMAEIALLKDE